MLSTTDVKFLLSAPQATSGDSMAGVAGNSLGLFASATQLSTADGGLDNLFQDLTGAQNAVDQVDYACVFIWNSNQTNNTMLNPVAWLPLSLLGPGNTATFAVGADTNGPSVLTSTSPQALFIQSPVIEPTGITIWAAPSATDSSGVPLPNIPPGYVMAVWIQRTANGGASSNSFNLEVTFDSLA